MRLLLQNSIWNLSYKFFFKFTKYKLKMSLSYWLKELKLDYLDSLNNFYIPTIFSWQYSNTFSWSLASSMWGFAVAALIQCRTSFYTFEPSLSLTDNSYFLFFDFTHKTPILMMCSLSRDVTQINFWLTGLYLLWDK